MKKLKLALFAVAGIVICLAVLRERGVIDASVYKSELSASQSTGTSQTHSGEEKHFSYHLVLKHNNELLFSRTEHYANLPTIEIEAVLEEPVYSGNSALPFIKHFKMSYRCTFASAKSSELHSVDGKIEGEVTARIYGLCSRRKARALAFEEAKKQIETYFQNQFNR